MAKKSKKSKNEDKKVSEEAVETTDTADTTEGGAESAPANLPLFYNKPAPLDASKHKDMGLKENFGLDFTKGSNAVPINMIEMPQISHHYPIAFSPDAQATPVAIMGLRDSENLFVNEDGTWSEQTYIPAYIRRYPFIFSEFPNTDQLTLCVDMDDSVMDEKSEQKFFKEDGSPSELSQNALEFCKSYHAAAQQTVDFCKALVDNDLLIDRQADINTVSGKRISFSGFRIIDEKKLNELSDDVFMDWRKKGWLPFIYAHLFSGSQWQRLTALLNSKIGDEKE